MKRRIFSLLLAGVLAMGLSACGGGSQPAESQPTGIDQAALKVGLLLAGEAQEADSTGHIQGLTAACEALGLNPDTQLVVKAGAGEDAACADAIGELIDAGCQAVFATSPGQEMYLVEAAADSPQVQFCHAGGYQGASDNLDNTHNYFAKLFQARYLAGIAAGLNTETNKLGYVASRPFAQDISSYTAFYLGARSVNPQVTMLVSYTNGDDSREAAQAQALIDQGCDVISQHTGTSAAADTAEANGVFAVGCGSDMTAEAPHATLVSARIDWSVYYTYALDCLLTGQAIPQDWCGDYAAGACTLTPLNEAIAAQGTKEAMDTAASGLADGSVEVFTGPLYGVDADGNELNLAEGESYVENGTTTNGSSFSAPSFAFVVDGVTVLS